MEPASKRSILFLLRYGICTGKCTLGPFASLGITVTVLILTLLRIVAGKALCLNAGRVLHNK